MRGSEILRLRKLRCMSRARLALLSGIHERTIERLEVGDHIARPSTELLLQRALASSRCGALVYDEGWQRMVPCKLVDGHSGQCMSDR